MDKRNIVAKTFLKIVLTAVLGALLLQSNIILADTERLSFDQAFPLTVKLSDDKSNVQLDFGVTPGYSLYRDHLEFRDLKGKALPTQNYILPPALKVHDEDSDEHWIYKKNFSINLPLVALTANAGQTGFRLNYQGCKDGGFCYAPQAKQLLIAEDGQITMKDLSQEEFSQMENSANSHPPNTSSQVTSTKDTSFIEGSNNTDQIISVLHQKSLPFILLAFLGFGLLLSFTPCVLPMLPILASILVGEKEKLTKMRALILSGTYVLSIAICYSLAGIAAGFLGQHLQVMLQQPLLLVVFSFILLLFALSQFNFIRVELPRFFSDTLHNLQQRQKGGSIIGAASMGIVSALILSPCVTPALIAALTFITQTRNAALGGSALFALALGMGLPLVLVALVGSHFLPKAGAWMVKVKYVTGILLLVLGVSILLRAVPINAETVMSKDSIFTSIQTTAELKQALKVAQEQHQPVLLDVYADWCVSCREMDKEVFQNPSILPSLQNVTVLRLDLTRQTQDKVELQKSLDIIGPPMILFFNSQGEELKNYRTAGKLKPADFNGRLAQFLENH